MRPDLSDTELAQHICSHCGSLRQEHKSGTECCLRFGDARHPQSVNLSDGWKFRPWGSGVTNKTAFNRARLLLAVGHEGPAVPKRTVGACICPIADLLSDTGHASACPERKVR